MKTDLCIESSYLEDGILNILVSPVVREDENPNDPEPRWTILVHPKSRRIKSIEFFVATNEGFEYPAYTPTKKQLALFRKMATSVTIPQ